MDIEDPPKLPFEWHTLLPRHLEESTLFARSARALHLDLVGVHWNFISVDTEVMVNSHPSAREDLTTSESGFLSRYFGLFNGVSTRGYPKPLEVAIPKGESLLRGYKTLFPFPVIKPQPAPPGGKPYAIVECGTGCNITYVVSWYDEAHPCTFPGLEYVTDEPADARGPLCDKELEADILHMLLGRSWLYFGLEALVLSLLKAAKKSGDPPQYFPEEIEDTKSVLGPTGALNRTMALCVTIRDIILRLYSEECLTAAGVDITKPITLSPRLSPVLEYMTRLLLYWGGAGPTDRVRLPPTPTPRITGRSSELARSFVFKGTDDLPLIGF